VVRDSARVAGLAVVRAVAMAEVAVVQAMVWAEAQSVV
jgi:hypothetical protein